MKKKILTSLLSTFAIFTIMTIDVSAYSTFNNNKLTYGVGNYGKNKQYYWIDSSASAFNSYITGAMNDWVYTTSYWGITTPISYAKTTTQSSSRMDIYKTNTTHNWTAITYFYSGSTEVDPYKGNWSWGKIVLDSDFSSVPNNKKRPIIAHEMGHVMGLAHTNSTKSLMRPDINSSTTTIDRAQPDDLAGINFLY